MLKRVVKMIKINISRFRERERERGRDGDRCNLTTQSLSHQKTLVDNVNEMLSMILVTKTNTKNMSYAQCYMKVYKLINFDTNGTNELLKLLNMYEPSILQDIESYFKNQHISKQLPPPFAKCDYRFWDAQNRTDFTYRNIKTIYDICLYAVVSKIEIRKWFDNMYKKADDMYIKVYREFVNETFIMILPREISYIIADYSLI